MNELPGEILESPLLERRLPSLRKKFKQMSERNNTSIADPAMGQRNRADDLLRLTSSSVTPPRFGDYSQLSRQTVS